MVVYEEDLEFLGQKQGSLLEDEVDGLQHQVADLVLPADHGDERGTNFVVVGPDGLSAGEIVHVSDDEPDGGQGHCRVGVGQPARDPLHDALCLMRVLRNVPRQGVQDVYHSPLVAVVHGSQQLLDHHLAQLQLGLPLQLAADGEGD